MSRQKPQLLHDLILAAIIVAASSFFFCDHAPAGEKKDDGKEEAKVSLQKPYPIVYKDAPTDKISVQYAVQELCRQAGKGYDYKESLRLCDALARRWITPQIDRQELDVALSSMLTPLGLGKDEVDGRVVVSPMVVQEKTGKTYHLPACRLIKKTDSSTTLRAALASGCAPCTECHVKTPDQTTKKTIEKPQKDAKPDDDPDDKKRPSETYSAKASADLVVLETKTGQCYHLPGCETVIRATKIKLGEAVKKGLRPCRVCEPPELE